MCRHFGQFNFGQIKYHSICSHSHRSVRSSNHKSAISSHTTFRHKLEIGSIARTSHKRMIILLWFDYRSAASPTSSPHRIVANVVSGRHIRALISFVYFLLLGHIMTVTPSPLLYLPAHMPHMHYVHVVFFFFSSLCCRCAMCVLASVSRPLNCNRANLGARSNFVWTNIEQLNGHTRQGMTDRWVV